MGYLNIIIKNLEGTSTFYSLTDILNFDENKIKTINHELSEMMKAYKMRLPKEEEVADEFIDNLKILKKWLIKDLAEATSSRYSLSIDEIGDLYFLKSRGSLGKTLTIRKDILILLTSIIVKDEKN
ncbi:DNA phosphorothioation-dependent restriction protein DptG [Staphylococcus petrasii]|uniref:DNA phosphorothioation-dependent restriction protein DptG n=1 Tax=Staphylococcus petrasii TaxID=1276936 RepID=UPI0035E80780